MSTGLVRRFARVIYLALTREIWEDDNTPTAEGTQPSYAYAPRRALHAWRPQQRFVMTAPFEVLRRAGRAATSQLSTLQADTLRALLLAEMGKQAAQFAQHAAALADLTASSSEDTTAGRARAMAALHAYRARAAIEEIEDALVRIEDGGYGTCQSCDWPIPFERLEAVPQARFCAACATPAASAADRPAGPRLGPGRGEPTGALPPPPVCSPQYVHHLASPTSETSRGTPTAR
jgi:DnaK suppressor protein